jgi:hypothetical protein
LIAYHTNHSVAADLIAHIHAITALECVILICHIFRYWLCGSGGL